MLILLNILVSEIVVKNTNIFVFAKITPKPEFYNETASELAGILAATRSEDGCHRFDLHTSECERYLYFCGPLSTL